MNYIAAEVTKLAGTTIGRYVLPIEDVYILLEGKDFDGVQANRAVAGGFILIEFIPGGKILKPAKWIDGSVGEVIETLEDVTYVTKDGKQAKGTVQVVKQGSEVGFKKIISTLDEFWAQIPASRLEGIKKVLTELLF